MKYLLPLIIVMFAFTTYGYNTSTNDGLSPVEFSLQDTEIKLDISEVRQIEQCTIEFSKDVFNFGSTAGSSSVDVYIGNDCAWAAQTSSSWIHINSGGSGVGNGKVNFSVDSNNNVGRIGTILIAGKSITVNQQNGCTYTNSDLSVRI